MSQGCKGQFTNMYSFIFSFLCKIKLLVTPFQLLVSIYLQHKVVDKVVEYYSGYCFCSEKKIIKVSAQANFAHFGIIFSGCFMDNIYMSLH